jgi:thymidylate synthase ThyX
MIQAKIITDSISPNRVRLTTFVLEYPRFIHAELMTHRVFSRNASSSRAIPVDKILARIKEAPAMPIHWGLNQKGMQAEKEADKMTGAVCESLWLQARDAAVDIATTMSGLGIHKQVVNRLLEPFAHISVVLTATQFNNFFALRCHPAAQPEMRELAEQMRDLYFSNRPAKLGYGQWHLPFIRPEERLAPGNYDTKVGAPKNEALLIKASTARCARVSYLTHDKKNPTLDEDVVLHDRLLAEKHMSPFEHIATPASTLDFTGNFRGWIQYRKTIDGECFDSYEPPKNQ